MESLTFAPVENNDDWADFIGRTKTVCIYSKDRPGIASKGLVRLAIKVRDKEKIITGVYCVDAKGSERGKFRAHPSHFPDLKRDDVIDLTIKAATAEDCVEWLQENTDPERKAFAHILRNSLSAVNESNQVRELTAENLKLAKENLRKSEESEERASKDRLIAAEDRRSGMALGILGFLLGALFDIGWLESKFEYYTPKWLVITLLIVFTTLLMIWIKNRAKRREIF